MDSVIPLITTVANVVAAIEKPFTSRFFEAQLIIHDNMILLHEAGHQLPDTDLQLYEHGLAVLRERAALLELESDGNPLTDSLIRMYKHRRFLNEVIAFRQQVRNQISRSRLLASFASLHETEPQALNFDPQARTEETESNEDTPPFYMAFSPGTQTSPTVPDTTTDPNSELPLDDEPVTVGLIAGPAGWHDDVPELVHAILSSTPKNAGGNMDITVGRRDEHGLVVVHFASMETALAFENRWNAQPPPGYEDVPAMLQGLPAPEYSEVVVGVEERLPIIPYLKLLREMDYSIGFDGGL